MMLLEFEFERLLSSPDSITRELLAAADMFFEADDRARCVSVIERLYDLFNDEPAVR